MHYVFLVCVFFSNKNIECNSNKHPVQKTNMCLWTPSQDTVTDILVRSAQQCLQSMTFCTERVALSLDCSGHRNFEIFDGCLWGKLRNWSFPGEKIMVSTGEHRGNRLDRPCQGDTINPYDVEETDIRFEMSVCSATDYMLPINPFTLKKVCRFYLGP